VTASSRFDPSTEPRRLCKGVATGLLAFVALASPRAEAQPLRLRADSLVSTRSPVGLLVLSGRDEVAPWLDAETVTWLGVGAAGGASGTGDVLTVSVRARHAKTGSEVRVGRMVVTMGAVRPVHLDGARGLVRVLGGTTLESFVGMPVQRGFDYRSVGLAAGGRVAQAFDATTLGVSYLRRLEDGSLSDEELGADASLTPAPWLTAAARGAFDLVGRGPSDVLVSASVQKSDARLEVFGTHRSPGRMLPSTSLFSVLGDFASTNVGATARYRAFPRLELVATGQGQSRGDDRGGQGTARITLALDDGWDGTAALEVRRVAFADTRWTGARGLLSLPIARRIRASTELELVVPDDARGRGAVWPWALVALGLKPAESWELAIGMEALAGPSRSAETFALARLSYTFETTKDRRGARAYGPTPRGPR